MVIGFFASTRSIFAVPSSPLCSALTFMSLNAGMYFAIGSSSVILLCSASIITATVVIGLLIE